MNGLHTLSSRATFWVKFFFAPLTAVLFCPVTIGLWTGRTLFNGHPHLDPEKWLFTAFYVAGSAFLLWFSVTVKRVRVDASNLYISNFIREISVPLTMVTRVAQHLPNDSDFQFVTIRFNRATEFGDRIRFISKETWHSRRSEHAAVQELRERVDLARNFAGLRNTK